MLKKALIALSLSLFFCSQAYAFGIHITPHAKIARPPLAQYPYYKLPKGITFYGDYVGKSFGKPAGLTAHFAKGSPLAAFTRSPTNDVCTYIDSNGVIQLATANTPRFAGGYYDATGFHTVDSNGKSAKGLMVEGAITNRATYSSIPENAAWTKTNITAEDADAGSSSPDGTATSARLVATAGNGTFTQAYTDASAGVYTASLYIKRKTGTGVINLRANTGDAYTAITTSVLTTTWTRVSVSSSSLTNPTFDLQLVTDTDAVYIYGCQLEKNPYMTSLVPCATTAATRNAETLKYLIAGNRTAAQETIAIQFMPLGGSFANDGIQRFLMSTDASSRSIDKNTGGSVIRLRPNATDNSEVNRSTTTTNLVNTSYVYTATLIQNPSSYKVFLNGLQESPEGTTEWSVNTWDSDAMMWVGRATTAGTQLNGLIQGIHVYNRSLSSGEVLADKNLFSI
jgi:hypothetical protein